jgi:ferredoxin-NADP reductase
MIDGQAGAAAPSGLTQATWQNAVVTGSRQLTPRIKSFTLAPEQPFGFRAGQHVDVRLTAPDGYRAIRSYSIASAPQEPATVEIVVERLDDGEVSPFFHEVVAIGDEIEIRGPLGGHFVWSPADGGPLLLVGGGSGVVPLVSMIRARAASASDVAARLLVSARTWADIPFRDELIALHNRADGFGLVLTLTRDDPRRPGDFARRIDAPMVQDVVASLPAPPLAVFVCGTNAFVNAAADGALAAGIPSGAIRTERFGA